MKKKYIEAAAKRIKQQASVLVARPDFQRDMLELRNKWSIPKEGITAQSENEDWYKQLQRTTDDYFTKIWPKYKSELEKLKNEGETRKHKARVKELNDLAPLNAFRIDIRKLLKKYKLSPKWENPVKRYLLFNKAELMDIPIGVTIRTEPSKEIGTEKLLLEIEENTTLADIKAIWPKVKFFQENLSYYKQKKYQPIKQLERDKRAYELQVEGKTLDQIGVTLEAEFGSSLDYSQTLTIINRYKKRLNIN